MVKISIIHVFFSSVIHSSDGIPSPDGTLACMNITELRKSISVLHNPGFFVQNYG